MNARIHTKVIRAIAAAAMIAAAVAPYAAADSAKGTRIQIPPNLTHLRERGSTGYLPQVRHVVIPPALSQFQEPGSTGWVAVSARLQPSPKPVDPLAVSYLMGRGLSPSQVKSWTVGACSHRVKDASCYAMFPSQVASTEVVRSNGFQWDDAGIGAGFTLGIVLACAGAGLLISRQNRRQQSVHA